MIFKKVFSLFVAVCTVLVLGTASMAVAPENPEVETPSLYMPEELGFDEDTIFTDEEAQQLAKEISKKYIEESGLSSEPNPRLRNSVSGTHGVASIYYLSGSLYWGTSLRSGGSISIYRDSNCV